MHAVRITESHDASIAPSTSSTSRVRELYSGRANTYKVVSVLHDIEDDVVTITVERRGPTILGMPVDEAHKAVLTVKYVFDDGDIGDIVISQGVGPPLDTESEDRETDQVVVSE